MAREPAAPEARHQPEKRVTVRAHRHLKWAAFDYVERGLMGLCAFLLLGFTVCEVADVVCRNMGRPWLNANEFAGGLFVWGVFIGMGVAVRRDQHFRLTAVGEALSGKKRMVVESFNRLVILGVGLCMIFFGYRNYLNGFGSFLMPSVTPIAVLYAAIPVAGFLISLFTVEELANGWRHGFQAPGSVTEPVQTPVA